jgi:hypothetical protein
MPGRFVVMRKVADYRNHAEKCRELASSMTRPVDRDTMEQIAQSWEMLADLRKRDLEPQQDA